ncbi:hypothetical protein QV08_10590 [Gallibacterium salpingitidis]|uniref:Uncharacterized protein n=1 Tax=Gallibacterium salpingitidis TaxID=505341 RepID=A0AB36E2T5_9PAST|nr:hypothetical protein QV08_10590 [Gallibacterium salpingitidis]OBX06328.1 hypothetical protein QV09_12280 [Gallibacterium salpingitidis]
MMFIYRFFRRCFVLLLLTLILVEIAGIVYFCNEYSIVFFIDNILRIHKTILQVSIEKGFVLILLGDVISGGFFKYIKNG